MLQYQFQLALRSLRERLGLTLLMVLAMSVGLGLYVTFYTMAKNGMAIPHAEKATRLHLVQMDNREPSAEKLDRAIRLPDTTYQDAMNLLHQTMPATAQTYVLRTWGTLTIDDPNIRPVQTRAVGTTSAFFAMFAPPFRFGSGWNTQADEQGAAQIVLGKTMNDRLFGGENSVGKRINLNNMPMEIVGVIDEWPLSWRIYDRGYQRGYPHDFYVPAQYALNTNLERDVQFDCWSSEQNSYRFHYEHLDELKSSECGWLAFWAEIPEGGRNEYQNKLNAYITEQQAYGRFPRAEVDTYVLNIVEQMAYLNDFTRARSEVLIAKLFFAVCLLNAVGILLAKFIRRAKEVSIRRALGARQSAIIAQHVTEVLLLGVVSGALGLLVAWVGLKGMIQVRLYASDYQVRVADILHYFQMDWSLIGYAFFISIVSSLLVSIYPIWRLCKQPAATLLRSQ